MPVNSRASPAHNSRRVSLGSALRNRTKALSLRAAAFPAGASEACPSEVLVSRGLLDFRSHPIVHNVVTVKTAARRRIWTPASKSAGVLQAFQLRLLTSNDASYWAAPTLFGSDETEALSVAGL